MGRIDGPYSVSAARLAGLKHNVTQQALDILGDVKSLQAALRQLARGLVNYETAPQNVDLIVYYVNQTRRGFGGPAWQAAWAADKAREPLWTVEFDGITYVRIYANATATD